MLKIENLTYSYSSRRSPVLKDLSMEIEAGGIYGLLGLNGVGKTTLLNIISGLLTPTEGSVDLNGHSTRDRHPATLSDIFYVPEEISLPSVSIREYVDTIAQFYPRFSRRNMSDNLSAFGLSEEDKLQNLSMGQRKKAFLSLAIASNASLLLLDEPTNGLDIPGKKALRGILGSSVTDNRAVIISTHQIPDVQSVLDHVIVMREGRIMLNTPIIDIASILRFEITSSAAVKDTALFHQPVFSGDIVILPNTGGEDTEVDLETFFYFCISDPDTIQTLFP